MKEETIEGLIRKARRLQRIYDSMPSYSSKRKELIQKIEALDRKIAILRMQELEADGQKTLI